MACHAAAVLVVAVVAVGVAAVRLQKPDFSGQWTLHRAASTLGPGADAMQTAVLRIEHAEATFTIAARFEPAAGKPFEFAFERVTDGREVAGAGGVAALRWEGDALIATDRTQTPAGEVAMSWRYELVDGGRRLRATEGLRRPGGEQHNVWIFERR